MRLLYVFLAVVALSLFAGATQAQATDYNYKRIGNFAEAIGAGAGEFETVGRIAVDHATGNIYAVDRGNDRVQVFEPEGSSAVFLTSFSAGLDNPYGIAIEQSSGPGDEIDVYVSDAGNGRIVKLTSDGAAVPSFSADPGFTSPAAGSGAEEIGSFEAPLAVDPTSGDLLVADSSDNLVKRFDSEGGFEASFDGSTSPGGAFAGLVDIATAPNGDVYAVDSPGPIWEGGEGLANPSRVERFGSSGNHLATISALDFRGYGVVGFDANVDQVVLGDIGPATTATGGFTPAGRFIASFVTDSFVPPYWNTTSGIVVDDGPSGRLYIGSNTGLIGPSVAITVYEPVPLPTLTIDPVDPGSISPTEATLSGLVDPEGLATGWRFEYQEDGASSWTKAPVPDGDAGDGTSAEPVSVDIDGLQPNVLYHARLSATSSSGSVVTDPVEFTTDAAPPVVTTRWVAPRTTTTARLNGYVNPLNSDTTYYFEYGPTDSYGTSVPASEDAPIGDGRTPVLAAQEIAGLTPGATYHYRLVAENDGGSTDGDDMTFTTRTPTETGPPDRGIELVNAPEKGNQNVQAFDLASDRDQVLWGVPGGAPGGPSGASGSFLAERTENGWKSRSLLPPAEELAGGGDLRYDYLNASADFSKFVFDATQGFLSLNIHSLVRLDNVGNHDVLVDLPPLTESRKTVVSRDLERVFVNTAERFDPSHAEGTGNVYEVGSGTPDLVSAMPGTNEAPECGVLVSNIAATGFGGTRYPWVSDSGARAYFQSTGDECFGPENLYVRNLETSTTTLISSPPLTGPDMGAEFIRANSSGSKALYTTLTALDPDDHNAGRDIYLYTEGAGNECLTCVAGNAEVEDTGGAEAGVTASDDFSRIYFASRNRLVPGQGTQGQHNLYIFKGGQIHFISPSGEAGQTFESGGLTPDGKVLLFPSQEQNITSDDNGGTTQYYRYDDSDGSVECVSCPAGRTPTQSIENSLGFLSSLQNRPAISDDGESLVFQTREALLVDDINGTDDIYEWGDGKLRLVTDGETEFPDGSGALKLASISNDGANVLFSVQAKLTGYEVDQAGQLFTAHEGGGFPRPASPPAPCREDACQGPLLPSPPLSSTASSAFQGKGNVTGEAARRPRCRNGKVRRSGRCVSRKSKKKQACHKKKGKAKSCAHRQQSKARGSK